MANIDEARASLERMQKFDVDTLGRREELGGSFHFDASIEPARRLVRLYNQLSVTSLEDLPENYVEAIKSQANADFNRFQQMLTFDPAKEGNPTQTRNSLIQQVKDAYNTAFNSLYPFISYGMSKSVDFQRIETDARAMIQSVQDHTGAVAGDMEKLKKDAEGILADVRKVAAEQGVTQQATYFKDEADLHEKKADEWKSTTIKLAIGLGVFAFLSLWLHKIPGLDPDTPLRALQIVTSKLLIFVVIGYMLILAARNFLAHRHNAVVNRHRQNALMTFKALADAAKGEEAKDIVLAHAASCIFAPQETAYAKAAGGPALNRSIIELLPQSIAKLN